jgi:hypothetical protein
MNRILLSFLDEYVKKDNNKRNFPIINYDLYKFKDGRFEYYKDTQLIILNSKRPWIYLR